MLTKHLLVLSLTAVELRSNYKKMMGVLWVLDPVTGDFPLGPAPRNTKKDSVCDNPHISH